MDCGFVQVPSKTSDDHWLQCCVLWHQLAIFCFDLIALLRTVVVFEQDLLLCMCASIPVNKTDIHLKHRCVQVLETSVDDLTEEELETSIFQCSSCGAKREEAPVPQGRFRSILADANATAEVQCAPKVCELLSGNRPASAWGKPGDAQRAALHMAIGRRLGNEYRCTISVVNGRLYLNGLNEVKRAPMQQSCSAAKRVCI